MDKNGYYTIYNNRAPDKRVEKKEKEKRKKVDINTTPVATNVRQKIKILQDVCFDDQKNYGQYFFSYRKMQMIFKHHVFVII